MIRREDVADLREGDVVRIVTFREDGSRYVLEGPVKADEGAALSFWDYWLRSGTGNVPEWVDTLTVVSRAPRPPYVNSDRTEPVPGDVVREEDEDGHATVWLLDSFGTWQSKDSTCTTKHMAPCRLRLLVDGETGMPPAVQS